MNADMLFLLISIKNGQKSNKSFILYQKKKNCSSILSILWEEGYILGYTISKKYPKMFEIFLKYQSSNQVIKHLTLIKKPSSKIYCSSKQLSKLNFNLGLILISTSKGILTLSSCKKLNIGGELLCLIF